MKQSSMEWLAQDAVRLLDERNHYEVDSYHDLIQSYQQLLFRSHTMPSSSNISTPSPSQDPTELVASKYLHTIQQLEREVSEKNAQLAQYAGNQLQLVNENKQYVVERQQWEHQIDFFTKRLEEEMILNESKENAMKELTAALLHVREELVRHRELLETTEQTNEQLRRQITELEQQLLQKSTQMQEWLDQLPETSTKRRSSSSVKGGEVTTQELGESISRLSLDRITHVTSRIVSRVTHSIRAHATEINSVCFNGSGKVLFSGGSDGTVRAWDAGTCRPMGEYRGVGTAHPLLCVRVSEDGDMVLGTGCDRKCFVWRVGTGRVFQTLTGHKGKVLAAEFSNLAPHEVITGSSDRSMRIWDVTRGLSIQSIHCRSSCNDLAMARGGEFASAHQDSVVRFWDSQNKQLVREIEGLHSDQVTSVSFDKLGNYVLTNGRDHKLHLIDTRTFLSVFSFSHPRYQCGFDWCNASLSPDGAYAVAGSSNGALFVWNTLNGKLEKELTLTSNGGHQGAIACAVWRPDGTGVASCDKNGFLVLWD